MNKETFKPKRIDDELAPKEAERIDQQRREEAIRLGLHPEATWKEIEYKTSPTERYRVEECRRLRMSEDSTWEQLIKAVEQERYDAAKAVGLPENNTWGAIFEKRYDDIQRVRQANELGLPNNATWK